MSDVETRPVPGWAGLEADASGNIYRRKPNGLLRLSSCLNQDGYPCVNAEGTTPTVHRLVTLAFYGPRPEGTVVCHNNGVKTDNRVENLRYDTVQSNIDDRDAHGTTARGEAQGHAVLTEADVKIAKMVWANGTNGITQRRIASYMGVKYSTWNKALKGHNWAHVA